jgi:hypothetical protein
MKVTSKMLQKVAKELEETFFDPEKTPVEDFKTFTETEIVEWITDKIQLREPQDAFTEDTEFVLEALKDDAIEIIEEPAPKTAKVEKTVKTEKTVKEKSAPKTVKTEKVAPKVADPIPEEVDYTDLIAEINDATEMEVLLEIVDEEEVFINFRETVGTFKRVLGLKAAMLDVIKEASNPAMPALDPEPVKEEKTTPRTIKKAEEKVVGTPKTIRKAPVQEPVQKPVRSIKTVEEETTVKTEKEPNSAYAVAMNIMGEFPKLTYKELSVKMMELGIDPDVDNGARSAQLAMSRTVKVLEKYGHYKA